jgi:hypothetical protein
MELKKHFFFFGEFEGILQWYLRVINHLPISHVLTSLDDVVLVLSNFVISYLHIHSTPQKTNDLIIFGICKPWLCYFMVFMVIKFLKTL